MREQAAEVVARVKPRLRGVIHEYSFFAALALGALLIARANGGREVAAVAIYAAGICGLFGVSALYHRVTWRPRARAWMRRLDHSMIFVFIAASFTPFALLVLDGTLATTILAVVWGGALAGRRVVAALGRSAEVGHRARLRRARDGRGRDGARHVAGARLAAGRGRRARRAALHGGAVIYATERPDPAPAVYGYHEVFHTLVTGAAAMHYAVIAFAVAAARELTASRRAVRGPRGRLLEHVARARGARRSCA